MTAPAMSSDPLTVLRELQHSNHPPRVDLVSTAEIMAMLPESLQGSVSLKWIRQNVPGKRRVGRQDMWPRSAVLDYFLTTGMVEPDDPR